MKSIIAKKIGMTQLFDENSVALGVTLLDVSGCRVVQIKSDDCLLYTYPSPRD